MEKILVTLITIKLKCINKLNKDGFNKNHFG